MHYLIGVILINIPLCSFPKKSLDFYPDADPSLATFDFSDTIGLIVLCMVRKVLVDIQFIAHFWLSLSS